MANCNHLTKVKKQNNPQFLYNYNTPFQDENPALGAELGGRRRNLWIFLANLGIFEQF